MPAQISKFGGSIFRHRVTHLWQLPLGERNVNLNVERDLCTPTNESDVICRAICCPLSLARLLILSTGGPSQECFRDDPQVASVVS